MTGLNEFLKLFGDLSVANVVEIILALVFMFLIYRKVKNYFAGVYEAEKSRDEQLKEAVEGVRKFQALECEISALRKSQEESMKRLFAMEEMTQRRERNKLRDLLLQNYRYYTNSEINPSHSWTRMESEDFWELFKDYEEAGGNGYVHTVVQPAMLGLTITDVKVH